MNEETHTVVVNPVEELERRRAEALAMGGEERIARHHASGRLTARERIALLVDEGSWREIGLLALPEIRRDAPSPGDAIVTGFGRIDGGKVGVVAIDAAVLAGTTAPVNMRKQNRVAEWAGRKGLPLIFLSDNDGGRIPDLLGWRFSGVPFAFTPSRRSPAGSPATPRITAVVGPSFGDAALHAAIANLVVMKRDASLALSVPPVIKGAIGEDVSNDELGGPQVAHETSGSAHVVVDGEEEAIDSIKRLLAYMPDAPDTPAPVVAPVAPQRDPEELTTLVPSNPRRGYDMRKLLQAIVDEGTLFNWGERYGRSLITALARIQGQPVGVVA